jgi:hypothetical protein
MGAVTIGWLSFRSLLAFAIIAVTSLDDVKVFIAWADACWATAAVVVKSARARLLIPIARMWEMLTQLPEDADEGVGRGPGGPPLR